MNAPSGSKVRTLASYTAWWLGAQIATALLQFGYASVTSRLVPDVGFGAYAVAMTLAALVTLIATAALGQAAARTPELHRGKLSFLVLLAVGIGFAAALVNVLIAEPWAALWGVPDAVNATRLIAVSAFVAPISALLLGVQRRLGGFRALAVSMVTTSIAGMAIGVLAVVYYPSPVTLAVSPVVATVLLTAISLILTRRHWWAKPDFAAARGDLGFGWRTLAVWILAYLGGNMGRWSVSRWVGADALGQWNRADVLVAVPIGTATSAVVQAVYPEIRHDIGVQSRTRAAWTDYLLLVAWVFFPAAAILAGIAPIAIAILFGPGWGLATAIAPLVAVQKGIAAVESALASALESVGHFRIRVWTALVAVAVTAAGAVLTKLMGSWSVALAAMIVSSLLQHLLQVVFTARLGALDGWSLAKGYTCSLAVSTILGGAAAVVSAGMLGRVSPLAAVAGTVILIAAALAGISMKRHLPPVKILARYRSDASAAPGAGPERPAPKSK